MWMVQSTSTKSIHYVHLHCKVLFRMRFISLNLLLLKKKTIMPCLQAQNWFPKSMFREYLHSFCMQVISKCWSAASFKQINTLLIPEKKLYLLNRAVIGYPIWFQTTWPIPLDKFSPDSKWCPKRVRQTYLFMLYRHIYVISVTAGLN